MLRTLIVEDNPLIQKNLSALLRAIPDCSLLGVCDSIAGAHTLLTTVTPDVVLLDVALKDGNAFELLAMLPVINFRIIFVTAFDTYAIKAIKLGAFDYLLKPLDAQELRQALDRVRESMLPSQEQVAVSHLDLSSGNGDRIVLKEQHVMRVLRWKDILYCRSDNGYTTFFLRDNRKVMVSGSIKEYEKLLPSSCFCRVHQSYIVNLDYIELYNRTGSVLLQTGVTIPVSVRKREEVIKVLTRH